MDNEKRLSIKSWPESDRPREKMLEKGRSALSDAELLAIIIGSGTAEATALDLGKQLLAGVKNDLNELGKLDIDDFCKIKGIGKARAVTIAASLELGRRRKNAEIKVKTKITSSREVYDIFGSILCDLPYEEFWILLLNKGNGMIEKIKISRGGISGTITDIRLIVKSAIDKFASSVIAVHNHPSGNSKPGNDDRIITQKIKAALSFFDIILNDHVIIADNDYFSFADENIL